MLMNLPSPLQQIPTQNIPTITFLIMSTKRKKYICYKIAVAEVFDCTSEQMLVLEEQYETRWKLVCTSAPSFASTEAHWQHLFCHINLSHWLSENERLKDRCLTDCACYSGTSTTGHNESDLKLAATLGTIQKCMTRWCWSWSAVETRVGEKRNHI